MYVFFMHIEWENCAFCERCAQMVCVPMLTILEVHLRIYACIIDRWTSNNNAKWLRCARSSSTNRKFVFPEEKRQQPAGEKMTLSWTKFPFHTIFQNDCIQFMWFPFRRPLVQCGEGAGFNGPSIFHKASSFIKILDFPVIIKGSTSIFNKLFVSASMHGAQNRSSKPLTAHRKMTPSPKLCNWSRKMLVTAFG